MKKATTFLLWLFSYYVESTIASVRLWPTSLNNSRSPGRYSNLTISFLLYLCQYFIAPCGSDIKVLELHTHLIAQAFR